jgi:hypothetical protein
MSRNPGHTQKACQKRPGIEAKKTYYRGKRDLLMTHTWMQKACQKRPGIEAKETYYRCKRDLLMTHTWMQKACQKRPGIEAKKTYYRGKRDLLMTHTWMPGLDCGVPKAFLARSTGDGDGLPASRG